jgi:hypothetical protein
MLFCSGIVFGNLNTVFVPSVLQWYKTGVDGFVQAISGKQSAPSVGGAAVWPGGLTK